MPTKNSSKKQDSADLSRLSPFAPKDKELIQVIIETPRGSRNKFAYDAEQHAFELKKVLPAGMAFPYDFGFVPSTEAEDGDPIDVLVLMEEPVPVGALVKCRLIGAIQGKQTKKGDGKAVRNDRLLAVERGNHEYSEIADIRDLSKKLLKELEQFFVNYHELEGNKYEVLDRCGRKDALKLLNKAMQ
jgi:inorganic pyrophosphatase